MLIKALYESYRFVPIGGITFSGKAISEIISLFGKCLLSGSGLRRLSRHPYSYQRGAVISRQCPR